MQTNNYVFFNAVDAAVQVTVNNAVVGAAHTVDALVELLLRANVKRGDTLMCSSDVDFASEEGFANDDAAHAMIEQALEDAGLV